MAGINFIENEQYLPKLKFRNKMTKEEIRTKWIRHTPLMKLDECVDNAMDEYAKETFILIFEKMNSFDFEEANNGFCERVFDRIKNNSLI